MVSELEFENVKIKKRRVYPAFFRGKESKLCKIILSL